MRHVIIILAVLFAASIASADKPSASDDTVTLKWKYAKKIGDQYCRSIGGGNYCIDAKDVISIKEEGRYTIIVMRKEETKLKSYAGNAWSDSPSSSRTVVRKT